MEYFDNLSFAPKWMNSKTNKYYCSLILVLFTEKFPSTQEKFPATHLNPEWRFERWKIIFSLYFASSYMLVVCQSGIQQEFSSISMPSNDREVGQTSFGNMETASTKSHYKCNWGHNIVWHSNYSTIPHPSWNSSSCSEYR